MRDARHDHSQTPQCVELDLAGSTFKRGPMQIAIHHRHLLNALRLGMRRFHVHQSAYTLFSHARDRKFACCVYQGMVINPSSEVVPLTTDPRRLSVA